MTFTKKGYALQCIRPMLFQCTCETFGADPSGPRKTVFILSQLAVLPPSSRAQVVATVRGWLGAYGDDELIEKADSLIDDAFSKLPDEPPVTPPPPPLVPSSGAIN